MGTKGTIEGFFPQASMLTSGNGKCTENTLMTLLKVPHPHSDVISMENFHSASNIRKQVNANSFPPRVLILENRRLRTQILAEPSNLSVFPSLLHISSPT